MPDVSVSGSIEDIMNFGVIAILVAVGLLDLRVSAARQFGRRY